MPGKLEGRVAIVTGAASGIGRQAAYAFSSDGAKLVVADCNKSELETLVQDIQGKNGKIASFVCDMSTEASNKELVQFALDSYGAIHVAFLNAGCFIPGELEEITPEVLDKIFSINFNAVVFGLKHVFPVMRETAGGKGSVIITTSNLSTAVSCNMTGSVIYCASKAASKMVMKYAAIKGKDEIRVNAIAPGLIRTKMTSFLNDEEFNEFAMNATLLHKIGKVEDISPFLVYLASDDGGFTTGTEFIVDGGWSLRG